MNSSSEFLYEFIRPDTISSCDFWKAVFLVNVCELLVDIVHLNFLAMVLNISMSAVGTDTVIGSLATVAIILYVNFIAAKIKLFYVKSKISSGTAELSDKILIISSAKVLHSTS
ncbi:MAG: hypothetical protein FWD66_10900 [Paludibacter sp.]|nr:hypothetical protein [Paludibacter sp.]